MYVLFVDEACEAEPTREEIEAEPTRDVKTLQSEDDDNEQLSIEDASAKTCTIHQAPITLSQTGKRSCRSCRASFVWRRQLRRNSEYSFKSGRCAEHGSTSIARHPKRPRASYCVTCAHDCVGRSKFHIVCRNHGPMKDNDIIQVEGKSKCRLCKERMRQYPDVLVKQKRKRDDSTAKSTPISQPGLAKCVNVSAQKHEQAATRLALLYGQTCYSYKCSAHPTHFLHLGEHHVECAECVRVYEKTDSKSVEVTDDLCSYHQTKLVSSPEEGAYCRQCACRDGDMLNCRALCTVHGLLNPEGRSRDEKHETIVLCKICVGGGLITEAEWYNARKNGVSVKDTEYSLFCSVHPHSILKVGRTRVTCSECVSACQKYSPKETFAQRNTRCVIHGQFYRTSKTNLKYKYCVRCAGVNLDKWNFSTYVGICPVHGMLSKNVGRIRAKWRTDSDNFENTHLCRQCRSVLFTHYEWYSLLDDKWKTNPPLQVVESSSDASTDLGVDWTEAESQADLEASGTKEENRRNRRAVGGSSLSLESKSNPVIELVPCVVDRSPATPSVEPEITNRPTCSLHPQYHLKQGLYHFTCERCQEIYLTIGSARGSVKITKSSLQCPIHTGVKPRKVKRRHMYCPGCAYGLKGQGRPARYICPQHGLLPRGLIVKAVDTVSTIKVCSLCQSKVITEEEFLPLYSKVSLTSFPPSRCRLYGLRCRVHGGTELRIKNASSGITCELCVAVLAMGRKKGLKSTESDYDLQCPAHGCHLRRIDSNGVKNYFCPGCASPTMIVSNPAQCLCPKHGLLMKSAIGNEKGVAVCSICKKVLVTECEYVKKMLKTSEKSDRSELEPKKVQKNDVRMCSRGSSKDRHDSLQKEGVSALKSLKKKRQNKPSKSSTDPPPYRLRCMYHTNTCIEISRKHLSCSDCRRIYVKQGGQPNVLSTFCLIHGVPKKQTPSQICYCTVCAGETANRHRNNRSICPSHGPIGKHFKYRLQSNGYKISCRCCGKLLLSEVEWYRSTDLPTMVSRSSKRLRPPVKSKTEIISSPSMRCTGSFTVSCRYFTDKELLIEGASPVSTTVSASDAEVIPYSVTTLLPSKLSLHNSR